MQDTPLVAGYPSPPPEWAGRRASGTEPPSWATKKENSSTGAGWGKPPQPLLQNLVDKTGSSLFWMGDLAESVGWAWAVSMPSDLGSRLDSPTRLRGPGVASGRLGSVSTGLCWERARREGEAVARCANNSGANRTSRRPSAGRRVSRPRPSLRHGDVTRN